MIQEAISRLAEGKHLGYEEALQVMDEIMSGSSTPAQNAAFLTALHIKGETIDEITALANGMRMHCLPFKREPEEVLEIVGTGGDRSGTFNISTAAALIVSSLGVSVAKHGNRAASSLCGTADVLEELGVKLDAEVSVSEKALSELGLCFLFAQKYHTAMKYVGGVRREIGIPTVFNILGPLANPARANLQLLGVYDQALAKPLAQVLYNLGVKRGMAVHGMDGLDEITLSDKTFICEIDGGRFTTWELDPRDYGLSLCKKEELVGGSPAENAKIMRELLEGAKGPKRDAAVLNAAAALHIAKEVSIEEGIEMAKEALDSGKAKEQLARFAAATQRE